MRKNGILKVCLDMYFFMEKGDKMLNFYIGKRDIICYYTIEVSVCYTEKFQIK